MPNSKIIVGVHGIGDQVRYETIQAIAYQFCRHYEIPAAVPVGGFHSANNADDGILHLQGNGEDLYFSEVHWADIARKPENDGYVLEETKKWAKTIVERLRSAVDEKKAISLKAGGRSLDKETLDRFFRQDTGYLYVAGDGSKGSEKLKFNYRMIKSVLYETIDTVRVAEQLLFVTDKAGLFRFDLNKLLVDFLGDVQVVTEFKDYRKEILDQFFSVMDKAHKRCREADIYIIAHSEGTVVSLLALLKAIYGSGNQPDWLRQVKGFMTLGSPIDKHIILWPGIWQELGLSTANKQGEMRISWRNYYDKGDPVGYELDTARAMLEERQFHAFDFKKEHDYGFNRYYLPGKAHVDYWRDDEVFDHFINTVIKSPKNTEEKPPKNSATAWLTTCITPYAGIYGLLFMAAYFLYKAVHECISPEDNESALVMMKNVGGIAAVLGGMTVMARIPRLSRNIPSYLIAGIIFLASLISYSCLVEGDVQARIGGAILTSSALNTYAAYAVPFAATVVVAGVFLLSYISASVRTIPLIAVGGAVVLWIAGRLIIADESHLSVWPVFIGSALFLYIWWLAILLFDLVFVWHWYIRNSKALKRLRKIR